MYTILPLIPLPAEVTLACVHTVTNLNVFSLPAVKSFLLGLGKTVFHREPGESPVRLTAHQALQLQRENSLADKLNNLQWQLEGTKQ